MAAHSARTAAQVSPSLGRFVLTNVDVSEVLWRGEKLFDIRVVPDKSSENRKWKTSFHEWSPFHKVLFLDCDTEIRGDVRPLFSLLKSWPILAKQNALPSRYQLKIGDEESLDLRINEWNTGVIAADLQNLGAREFLSKWKSAYHDLGISKDQASFMSVVYDKSTIIPLSMSGIWNARDKEEEQKFLLMNRPDEIRIFHYIDPGRSESVAREIRRTISDLRVSGREDSVVRLKIEEVSDKLSRSGVPMKKEEVDRAAKRIKRKERSMSMLRRIWRR